MKDDVLERGFIDLDVFIENIGLVLPLNVVQCFDAGSQALIGLVRFDLECVGFAFFEWGFLIPRFQEDEFG